MPYPHITFRTQGQAWSGLRLQSEGLQQHLKPPEPGPSASKAGPPRGHWWVTSPGPRAARPESGGRARRQPEEKAGAHIYSSPVYRAPSMADAAGKTVNKLDRSPVLVELTF